jgi:hypothetical protein
MASQKWKRLQFFQPISLLSEVRKTSSESKLKAAAQTDDEARFIHEINDLSFMLRISDMFFIGSARGIIFVCINDLVKGRFNAYNNKLLVMTKSPRNSVRLT